MDNKEGLGRLCNVYEQLNGWEREEVIRLAEELLDTQKAMRNEKTRPAEKTTVACFGNKTNASSSV